jgi:predicted transcriptional regulator
MENTPQTSQKSVPLSIKLEADQKQSLAQIAKEEDRSVHFLLCQAVKEFIEREQAKTDFHESAVAGSEHFNATGLHTTHEELKVWAQSLGTKSELTPPVCHE